MKKSVNKNQNSEEYSIECNKIIKIIKVLYEYNQLLSFRDKIRNSNNAPATNR